MSDEKFKKPASSELKEKLSPLQYRVTQQDGTEAPFDNEYWDNHEAGIYVDVVTGDPLFSSTDKFDSGTGWPSFVKPIGEDKVKFQSDKRLLKQTRVEVRSSKGDSHLGHVFDDGPGPTGKRYCVNSAALRFIPAKDLESEGYSSFKQLFASGSAGAKSERAILAGGCFWGMEDIIREIPGVLETKVGYTGGKTPGPVYELVKTGSTGHAESIEVVFDPQKVSYESLLGVFFRMHDPTTLNRQGNDRGTQYRSAIFYLNDEQRKIAEKVRQNVDRSDKWPKPVVTEITAAGEFYAAEDYHQDYLENNPGGYTCHYLRE